VMHPSLSAWLDHASFVRLQIRSLFASGGDLSAFRSVSPCPIGEP
jgi:hypothetical protein